MESSSVSRRSGEAESDSRRRGVPAFGARGERVVGGEGEHGELSFAERRLEVFEGLQGVHPAAEGLLAIQQVLDGLLDLRVVGGDAGDGEGPEGVAGLKFDFGLLGVEAHGPLAAGALQGEDALRVGANLRGVLRAIDIGEGQGLVAEIDHVLHVALRDHAGQARVVGGLPGIPGDFVGADQRSVAVGLIGRELFAPGVIELQVFGDLDRDRRGARRR